MKLAYALPAHRDSIHVVSRLMFGLFLCSPIKECGSHGFVDCALVLELQESRCIMLTCRWYLGCGAAHPARMLAACASASLG